MPKIFLTAIFLMLLSSTVFAAQSHPEADDAITPVPKKVNMRPVQIGNLRGTMAPGAINTGQNPAGTLGQPVTALGPTETLAQPAVKVGKYLPSNRLANMNGTETPGVVGNPATDDGVGMNVKINHKNINQRTTEKLEENFD